MNKKLTKTNSSTVRPLCRPDHAYNVDVSNNDASSTKSQPSISSRLISSILTLVTVCKLQQELYKRVIGDIEEEPRESINEKEYPTDAISMLVMVTKLEDVTQRLYKLTNSIAERL